MTVRSSDVSNCFIYPVKPAFGIEFRIPGFLLNPLDAFIVRLPAHNSADPAFNIAHRECYLTSKVVTVIAIDIETL